MGMLIFEKEKIWKNFCRNRFSGVNNCALGGSLYAAEDAVGYITYNGT